MPKVTTELFCSICLNDAEGDWTSLIPCGHLFHEPCVRRWCNPPAPGPGEPRSKKPDWCPLCRAKILRPIVGGKRNTKENSRFRKLLFPNEVKVDLSSSPARGGGLSVGNNNDRGEGTSNNGASKRSGGRRGLIVGSSEDESDMLPLRFDTLQAEAIPDGDAILTESESDEDNARPARPVYPRGGATNATTEGRGRGSTSANSANNNASSGGNNNNETLGEARATIASKNEQLARLRIQLAETEEEVHNTRQALDQARAEQSIIEDRLKDKCEDLKRGQEEIRKLKEDKRGLTKSLKVEVEKVGELSKTNKKLIEEITVLKDEHAKLKHDHKQLEASYNTTIDDYQARLDAAKAAEKTYKDRFTRVFDLNRINTNKLDLKRERIKALEAEVAKYKNGEEAKRKAKGKGRALDQDNLDEGMYEHENSFNAPRSRQVSNRSIDDTSYMAQLPDEDFEESLLVTEVPESEGHEVYQVGDDEDDEDAFADLDVILSGPKPSKRISHSKSTILSRDPLKEWTNSEKGKSTARSKQSSDMSSGAMTSKKRNLTSVTSASDKWADMALFGTSKNGKSSAVVHGEKKKSRTAF